MQVYPPGTFLLESRLAEGERELLRHLAFDSGHAASRRVECARRFTAPACVRPG